MKLSSIGTRGLVVFLGDKEGFQYVTEGTWRQESQQRPPTANTKKLQELCAAVAPVNDAGSPCAFVNFAALKNLSPADPQAKPITPNPSRTAKWSIVVYENTTFYEIPSKLFTPLDVGSAGDAAVLVRRGAVLATIPKNNIPSGTFCVLVNMPAIGVEPQYGLQSSK
jgi:hypothetical protein